MEASHSGLVHTLGKRAGASPREFESRRLRHLSLIINLKEMLGEKWSADEVVNWSEEEARQKALEHREAENIESEFVVNARDIGGGRIVAGTGKVHHRREKDMRSRPPQGKHPENKPLRFKQEKKQMTRGINNLEI